MNCPYCSSTKLFQSSRGNRTLWILRWLLVSVRCYTCSRRFFRAGPLLAGRRYPAPRPQDD